MRVRRPATVRAAAAAVGVIALAPVLAGCGGGSSDSDGSGGGSGSGSGSGASTSSSSSTVAAPTGNPFTASLTGPAFAKPGQTVQAVLTNTGRLPNAFQFETDPTGAAVITPRTVTLSPGQKATVSIKVSSSPLNVNVESASGGLGDFVATLELGSDG